MIQRSTLIAALLATITGTALYLVKHETRSLEDRLADLDRAIMETQETIHVLKAEWSFLNQPGRLEALGTRLLQLERLRADQTVAAEALAAALAAKAPEKPEEPR